MFKLRRSYRILEPIGEGLNASVYKVSKTQPDLKTEHIFALKVLKNSSDLKVFKLEFETLLKANGKHLVRYCGWEHYKSRPALLLEYIDGVTLYELFKSNELKPDEVTWIFQETLKGIQELRDSKLAHGDLSLKNIMIQKDGQLKLIDFGLSHWSTQKIELTPEFADSDLLMGACPSFKTDFVSVQKIVRKISGDSILESELSPETPPSLTAPPRSLIDKTTKLTEIPSQTKRHSVARSEVKNPKHSGFSFAAWILTSLLFLTPASATNSTKKEMLYQIRSKSWLQVTNKKGQSCFTPCSLSLRKEDFETLEWKDQTQSGEYKLYTGSEKIISINL
jgi:serine/threonine protein kinase